MYFTPGQELLKLTPAMNKDNRVSKKKKKKKYSSILMTTFVNICCIKTIYSLPEAEVPYTIPETKLPKPGGQKGHTLIHPFHNSSCFPKSWCAKFFGLMNSASLPGSYRCLSQLRQDYLESERVWFQQGKYDSITASHRDQLADCLRDLGHALDWLSVWLIKQFEDLWENQALNLINF